MNIKDMKLTSVLHALSDPIRLEIVKALADTAEKTCGACTNINVAKSTLSHHFKVLREAGILKVRIEGKHHYYSLCKEELEQQFPGLIRAILQVEKEQW
ncbi:MULTISPECIES: ArsR/SmtB family transcription factor [Bacillus]|uniref:Transcriptional regulator n=1 Tax=Bacillus glycinifermentans TaxID=1664069 RepID=A0AAJ3YXX4_9BACI|nr:MULTISPECIES: metalloregulator ArsR/SmtB family transcription factor [Bacillus]KKB73488.1 ArsR family transcriptional regulator [Bacillus sp. TH008]MBU8788159.1 metalloregulator ArsR/SmtB family transcription factor [Bacillus glycinifermentans]MDU0073375.1 metalloregulator ArsR/SmtB family transcription factor [Bacillus sp. IG6]MED8021177.1 metalloregulator ArsR/SmtB family transcription factor [Bacillus glycinifermentans]NUJ18332.1 helix-turn-helix transcriptional regulator [Bacillus glyci